MKVGEEWFCVGPREGGFRCDMKNSASSTACRLCGYPRPAATEISEQSPVTLAILRSAVQQ